MHVSEAAGLLEGHQPELADATLRRLAAMTPDLTPDAARRDVSLHVRRAHVLALSATLAHRCGADAFARDAADAVAAAARLTS